MDRPKVGVGVIVTRGKKVLLGKRKNAHGAGTWHFPGGHLERFETIEECAKREAKEETDLDIIKIKTGPYTNDISKKEDNHYITLFAIAESNSGNPKTMEPEKCEGWEWFEWNTLPSPLFLPIKNLLLQQFNPFLKINP